MITNTVSPMGANASLLSLLSAVVQLELFTRICHWQVSGPHFRSFHRMFDEQAEELARMADEIAERGRALRLPYFRKSDDLLNERGRQIPAEAEAMLIELAAGNAALCDAIRIVRCQADIRDDLVTASLADGWLSGGERRIWILRTSLAGDAPAGVAEAAKPSNAAVPPQIR